MKNGPLKFVHVRTHGTESLVHIEVPSMLEGAQEPWKHEFEENQFKGEDDSQSSQIIIPELKNIR
jgi:hypothetical protein